MKKGDVINGYTMLRDFTTVGGGLSQWTFAAKGGREYFIKEFLFPTYPAEGAPGSARIKEQKRQQCALFEAHHKHLMQGLKDKCSAGGNLIVTKDFFRSGTKYYKTTDKVDVASLHIADIAALPLAKRVLILRTVAHSLRILHQSDIVHGDLKPNNILIKETMTGDYTTKLIDFDNSYFSGKPPANVEEVVGDMVYYSPELGRYIQGDKKVKPEHLHMKSDIFALGLIYCEYLTGDLPAFDQAKYKYPYAAVNHGCPLTCDTALPPMLAAILEHMLQENPDSRPDIHTVFEQLKHRDLLKGAEPKPVAATLATDVFKGALARGKERERPASPPTLPTAAPKDPETETSPSRLRGKGLSLVQPRPR